MTHDELIAKINHRKITNQHLVKDLTIQQAKSLIAPLVALRAVVELHKPERGVIESWFRWLNGTKIIGCRLCEELYPCPTIQAIEKELK
jgi:hypothetical protein